MLGTVRTSQTTWSSTERLDDLSLEGERNRFDEFTLVFNKDAAMMCGQRGHHILPFQLSADEVCGAVELDPAVGIDLANPGNQSLGNRQRQPALAVEIRIESKTGRQMTESRPEAVSEDAGKAGSVLVRAEGAAGLAEVIIIEESGAGPPQRSEVWAAVPKNPDLPGVIEALHSCVPTGLFWGDEEKVDPEKQMKSDDLRKAVTIPSSSRRGHLVVHLGDLGQAHKTPRINEMREQGERPFIPKLMGRSRLAGDIDGVEGIEPGETTRTSQMTWADQVGLLQVADLLGCDVGIGRPAGRTSSSDSFGLAGPGQDLLDGRDGRQVTCPAPVKLKMNRLGPDAGESRPSGLVRRQFVSESQDLSNHRPRSPVPDMLGGSTPVPESFQTQGFITTDPLGQPEAASLEFAKDLFKPNASVEKVDRPAAPFIFEVALHRPALLPFGMGRSLGDAKLVCDVLTVC